MAQVHSLRVRIYHSTSGTCSSFATVLRVILRLESSPQMGSNCPSMSRCMISKPQWWYTCCIFLTASNSIGVFWLSSFWAVLNLMSQAMEIKKGILLTYITSVARVTHQYCAMMVTGILEVCTFTRHGLCQTVFPLREPRSGPKMCSAARMSCLVMGQLGMRLLSTKCRKSCVLGHPIIHCILRASWAWE